MLQRPGRQRKRSSAKSSCGPSRTSSSAPSSPPCCNARCAPPRLATRRAPSCATCPGGCGATAKEPKLLILYVVGDDGRPSQTWAPIIDGTLRGPEAVFALLLSYARQIGLKGASWEAARKLLTEQYEHRTVIGLAAAADEDKSFSADTDMGEVLITARRRRDGESSEKPDPTAFVALRARPRSTTDAAGLAAAIRTAKQTGSRRITIGDEIRGVLTHGNWGAGCAASILHADLAELVENP